MSHETKTVIKTGLVIEKKQDKRKIVKKLNINKYTPTTGKMIKEQRYIIIIIKRLDRLVIDKEGSLEWLRGQLNWDGE